MSELLLIAILLVPVSFYLMTWRQFYFLNPINSFWLAYLHFGFVQPTLEKDAWIEYYTEPVFIKALLMILVLGISVILGYRSGIGKRISRRVPVLNTEESMERLRKAGLAITILGILGYFLVVMGSGGWARYSANPRNNTDFNTLSAYVYILPRLVSVGLLVLMCYAYSNAGSISWRLAITGIAVLNSVWLTYTGTREGAILMLVMIVGSVYGVRRRNPSLFVIAPLILFLVFLYGFIPTYRGQFRNLSFNIEDEDVSQVYTRSVTDFYVPSDSDTGLNLWTEFGMVLGIANVVPERVDYDYGFMLLELFTKFVPRQVWPDKGYPEGEAWDRFHRVSGISTSMNLAGLLSGPSPTMAGKYYYILGWPGLLIGGFMSGFLFRFLWEYLKRYKTPIVGAIAMISAAGLGSLEMTHPLSWSVTFWLPTVGVPILLLAKYTQDNAKAGVASKVFRKEPRAFSYKLNPLRPTK